MAVMMMRLQDEYCYHQHYSSFKSSPMDSATTSGYSSDSSSPSLPSPIPLIANPFYDPEYVIRKSRSSSESSSSSNGKQLIPNPFFDPSYAQKKSTQPSSNTPVSRELVKNPFYDPVYVSSRK
uniref:Ovule protein n=1 Tax=Caenorhabditis tropicalis TaxID=1561998 RepID=A0A1I7T7J0_9PELO